MLLPFQGAVFPSSNNSLNGYALSVVVVLHFLLQRIGLDQQKHVQVVLLMREYFGDVVEKWSCRGLLLDDGLLAATPSFNCGVVVVVLLVAVIAVNELSKLIGSRLIAFLP